MSSRRSNRHDDTRGAGAEADLGAAQTTIPRFLLVLVLVLFSPPTFSQEPASGTEARQEPEPALDAHHMTGFLDGMIGAQLREHAVAGAVAAVVHRGEVVHLEGYGYADVDAREPVDPEQTLFRIGSVTKLFTFTAVMQLVEEGRLDLDADVNGYLDFVIPATFAEPITLRHLMTHTAGFEEDLRNLFTEDPARVVSLGDWLRDNLPARVRPPGTFSAYSKVAKSAGSGGASTISSHVAAEISAEPTSPAPATTISS